MAPTPPRCCLLWLPRTKHASWGRRSLRTTASKFKEALIWQIRNGCTTKILEDRWCTNTALKLRRSVDPAPSEHRPDSTLFNQTSMTHRQTGSATLVPCTHGQIYHKVGLPLVADQRQNPTNSSRIQNVENPLVLTNSTALEVADLEGLS